MPLLLRNDFQTHFSYLRSQAQLAHQLEERLQSLFRITQSFAMELVHITLSENDCATASGVAIAQSSTASLQHLLQTSPTDAKPEDEHTRSSVEDLLFSVDAIKTGATLFCAPVSPAPDSELDIVPDSTNIAAPSGSVRKKVNKLPAQYPSDVLMTSISEAL